MFKHFQATPGKKKTVSDPSSQNICPYAVLIQTGSFSPQQILVNKWHEGSVFLTINPYCKESESKVLEIKGSFPADSEGTVAADFWLPDTVKAPKLIKLAIKSKLSKISKDLLYIRRITILFEGNKYRFPARDYLYPHNELQDKTGNGCIPYLLAREGAGALLRQETDTFLIQARNKDLEMTRSMVPWNGPNNEERPKLFPGFAGNQESKQEVIETFAKRFSQKAGIMALTNLLDDLLGVLPDTFTKLEQYAAFIRQNGDEQGWSKATVHKALKVAIAFDDDEELGRQMLCGPNASQIRQLENAEGTRWKDGLDKIPDHALEGKSFEDTIKQKKIFEVTNDNLIGVHHGGKASKLLTGAKQIWYVVPADCMFYVKDNKKLVPILIRLEHSTGISKETFWSQPAPDTEKGEHENLRWMLAKLYFRCADVNTHALCTHYARTHAVNEVFAVAAYRNLASAHPIFRFLQPHLQGIITVQLQARKFLIGKNSVFSKFLSSGDDIESVFDNYFKTFKYKDLVIPEATTKRGVCDIPDYFYRDDTLEYWKLIEGYTTEMVNLAYPSNEDIDQDIELQNFIREVVDEGFRYRGFSDSAGFPRSIPDKSNLVEYLTAIIFNISVFHAAANFEAFTYYSFTPNAPCCLKQQPPEQDEIVTMERILNSLPTPVISFISMDISYHLTSFSPMDRFYLGSNTLSRLGMTGANMAVAPEQVACLHRLTEGMRGLKKKIDQRNMGMYFKYEVLSPENVPIATQG